MPLFHIHGLVGACSRRSQPARASSARRASTRRRSTRGSSELEPTWYTAVPTMHQAVLARAPTARRLAARAALHPVVLGAAPAARARWSSSDVFGVPVIEAYGMTEAAHQMASNPLPPGDAEARARSGCRRESRSPCSTRTVEPAAAGERRRGRRSAARRCSPGTSRTRRLTPTLHRRLVPHRRRGLARRRRLPVPAGPHEGDHQPRWREDRAAPRSRRRCSAHPDVDAGRDASPCPTSGWARTSAPPSCYVRAGRGDRARASGSTSPTRLARLQGAEGDRLRGRGAEGADGQAPAASVSPRGSGSLRVACDAPATTSPPRNDVRARDCASSGPRRSTSIASASTTTSSRSGGDSILGAELWPASRERHGTAARR